MLLRLASGLLALLSPNRGRDEGQTGQEAELDRLRSENAELSRKAEELRQGNLALVRERRSKDKVFRDDIDRVRGVLREQGVNAARLNVADAVRQLATELSLLREKVGKDILRREGLGGCGTGTVGSDWEG